MATVELIRGEDEEVFSVKITPNRDDIGTQFNKAFSRFFNSPLFSDLTLYIAKEKFMCHRVILAASGLGLRKLLLDNQSAKEIRLDLDENKVEVFKLLLRYVYTASIESVRRDLLIPLIAIANQYGVSSLKEECGLLLASQVNQDNVFNLLQVASANDGVVSLQTKCAVFLAQHFSVILKENPKAFSHLDIITFAAMVESADIKIKTEKQVFDAILQYCQQFNNDKEKKENYLQKLLPCVRYNLLPIKFVTEELEEGGAYQDLRKLPLFRQILYETYRYKATKAPPTKFITKFRKYPHAFSRFSTTKKGPNALISEDRRTASNTLTAYDVVTSEGTLEEGECTARVKVVNCAYLGIGLIDASHTDMQKEFHNIPGCYVYYWSGPAYTNGGHDGNIETYGVGDVITVTVNLEEQSFELKKGERSIKKVTGVTGPKQFAVLLSQGASVTLVEEDDD